MTSYRILVAVIILLALAGNLFGFRSVMVSAIYPLQFAAGTVWKTAAGIPSSVISLIDLSRDNARLRQKLDVSLSQLTVLEELKDENERLRDDLAFQRSGRFGSKLLAAKVIGKSGSPWISILEINRGSSAGVRPDMPVVVRNGLAGKVIEVSQFSSKVLLITDAMSSVAAADQRSRDFGVVEGYAPNALLMKYVATGADIQEGDKIVSSSISSVFPAGIPIGTVSRAVKKEDRLFFDIIVKTAVKFSKLEEVFLVF